MKQCVRKSQRIEDCDHDGSVEGRFIPIIVMYYDRHDGREFNLYSGEVKKMNRVKSIGKKAKHAMREKYLP